MKKSVQKMSEITEEDDEETHCSIDPEVQKDRIRRIIDYQKSLYLSTSSTSSAASISSISSSSKSNNLLELMKRGSTSLQRLFDMEHTSLATHFTEYSCSPVTKPILLWGSDTDDGIQEPSTWEAVKTSNTNNTHCGSDDLGGFGSGSGVEKGGLRQAKRRMQNKQRLTRTKSFRTLPRFNLRRCRGFRFRSRLKRLRIMICWRKF